MSWIPPNLRSADQGNASCIPAPLGWLPFLLRLLSGLRLGFHAAFLAVAVLSLRRLGKCFTYLIQVVTFYPLVFKKFSSE
jgi:hypothetical protein